jgi:hypothetical protein
MPDANEFAEFLRRIRAGDQQAAVELVHQYEPFIRREVRTRLRKRPVVPPARLDGPLPVGAG